MNRYPGIFFIRRLLSIACCLLFIASINAQKKPAFVSGKVLDENENPLSRVSVAILGRQTGIITGEGRLITDLGLGRINPVSLLSR